jgi:hypothetical protein
VRCRLTIVWISKLLSDAGDDSVRTPSDGRFRLPDEWRYLALAVDGQAEAKEVIRRQAGGIEDQDAALQAAAMRMNASSAWPPARVSVFSGDDSSRLGQWRMICLGPRTEEAPRTALMDTTALFTVLRLVQASENGLATPLTVLDLVTFLDTACLYDRICFLENPHITLSELESVFGRDLFVELPVRSTAVPGSDYAALGDVRDELVWLYKSRTVPWINDIRTGRFGTKKQRKAFVKAWTTILRRDCDPDWLLLDPNESKTYNYDDVWNSPTNELFQDIVAVTTEQMAHADSGIVYSGRGGSVELARTSNARALFNAGLAQLLDVPYAASASRYPILKLLIAQTRGEFAELLVTSRGARALEEAFDDSVADLASSKPDALRLPFFPSAILNRIQDPGQLPEQLAWVRARSAALRTRLAELDRRLILGDKAGRNAKAELRAAVADVSSWERAIPLAEVGAATGEAVLAWADPTVHVFAIAVALLHGIVAGATTQTILARNRPRYRILRQLDPVINSSPLIAGLWRLNDPDRFTDRMRELASVTRPV